MFAMVQDMQIKAISFINKLGETKTGFNLNEACVCAFLFFYVFTVLQLSESLSMHFFVVVQIVQIAIATQALFFPSSIIKVISFNSNLL